VTRHRAEIAAGALIAGLLWFVTVAAAGAGG